MAKSRFALLALTLASALLSVQAMGQTSGIAQTDIKGSFIGGALTCSQPEKLTIPKPIVARAKLKARLATILRESLYDDSKGIVNAAREKEIKNLASKLKNDKTEEIPTH